MDPDKFEVQLDTHGELHLYLDSGKELHVHKTDTEVIDDDWAIIDSKEGTWGFHTEKIEYIEYPESHA
jgi:hypothetical protein